MQEELKEIEILVMIYKMLKEKAEKRVSKHDTGVYRCDDSNLFELYEVDGEEEFLIGRQKIPKETLELVKNQLKEPEPFYCQEGGVCDRQCTTCLVKEVY